jgi:hypothetical protein
MVNCCVNPLCRTEFQLLDCSDLYALERPGADPEFFWLCSTCASTFDLCLDRVGCILLRTRGENAPVDISPPDARLHRVARARRHMPWNHAIPAGVRQSQRNFGNWDAAAHGIQH